MASQSQPPPPNQSHYCKRCKLFFHDFDALHEHKVRSDRHNVCYLCAQEFISLEGLDRHCKQDHAHAQNLRCTVCHKNFTTLGGLTNHIESEVCSVVDLAAQVKEKTALKVKMDAARHYKGGRSGGNAIPEDEPRPALRDYSKAAGLAPSVAVAIQPKPGVLRPPIETKAAAAVLIEEDLIDLDEPTQIMNAAWDEPLESPLIDQFPVFAQLLRPSDTANTTSTASTLAVPAHQSMVKRVAALRAVPAHQSVIKQVATSGPAPAIAHPKSPWDPENPAFNAATFYNQFSKTYHCPHQSSKSCKKPIHTLVTFIQHLKSTCHRNERLQCHGCHRYFDTATALAQHASSQGVRCTVRESDDYENEVDRFTAGHAATDGRFDDDTIRYVATGLPLTAKELADNHRNMIAEKDEAKMSYWKTHQPKW